MEGAAEAAGLSGDGFLSGEQEQGVEDTVEEEPWVDLEKHIKQLFHHVVIVLNIHSEYIYKGPEM